MSEDTLGLIQGSAFIALIVLAGIGFALSFAFLRRLRLRHADTWIRLGSPTLFMNSSIQNQTATMRFVWSGGSRTLGDPTLVRLVNLLRGLTVVYLLVFACSIGLMLSR